MTIEWTMRDEPLDRCPEAWCRRARTCRNAGTGTPCLRTHQDMDQYRYALADRLDALRREMIAARGYELLPCSPYELDVKLGHMKQLLEEADREDTQKRMKEMAQA